MNFSTKARNLENLINISPNINVLPISVFTVQDWQSSRVNIVNSLINKFSSKKIIVRSSKQDEDKEGSSKAGAYLSLQNISCEFEDIVNAVNRVINSYANDVIPSDQVFIQPMLENVVCSGVLFTREMSNGSPYRVINYSDISTDAVTSGGKHPTKKFTQYRCLEEENQGQFSGLIKASKTLEQIFQTDQLDIEFGIDDSEKTYIFQVRPLKIANSIVLNDVDLLLCLSNLEKRIDQWFNPHPYLHGNKTLLGVMPDWNPAEIIGIRPRPLAMTLYKELVTDSIWAYQRSNYGYRNLRSFPLMLNIVGIPYIDVRVSFNSFLPKNLSEKLGNKLVNYYINKLIDSPSLHDKVEFEIVLSCYTFDIDEKIRELKKFGFSADECKELITELRGLTNEVIRPNGIIDEDLKKIDILLDRYEVINKSNLRDIDKIYWYLEDCKRYGTLPFAGLARAAFISVQLLTSLVRMGVVKNREYEFFMRSIRTVGTEIANDFNYDSKEFFIKKYGHLRPGTYDINSKRYDEAVDEYFKWDGASSKEQVEDSVFAFDDKFRERVQHEIDSHRLNTSADELFSFFRKSIESRELSKFHFTRNISEALKLIAQLGEKFNLSRDDMSYINLNIIYEMYSGVTDEKKIILDSIEKGKNQYQFTKLISLPALIKNKEGIKEFYSDTFLPNFITRKKSVGYIVEGNPQNQLQDKIVFIECADPGYDWIFTHNIKGFVTAYGGANSHMAIRANELGIPAVVGAGEQLFTQWKELKYIEINCENHSVRGLN